MEKEERKKLFEQHLEEKSISFWPQQRSVSIRQSNASSSSKTKRMSRRGCCTFRRSSDSDPKVSFAPPRNRSPHHPIQGQGHHLRTVASRIPLSQTLLCWNQLCTQNLWSTILQRVSRKNLQHNGRPQKSLRAEKEIPFLKAWWRFRCAESWEGNVNNCKARAACKRTGIVWFKRNLKPVWWKNRSNRILQSCRLRKLSAQHSPQNWNPVSQEAEKLCSQVCCHQVYCICWGVWRMHFRAELSSAKNSQHHSYNFRNFRYK